MWAAGYPQRIWPCPLDYAIIIITIYACRGDYDNHIAACKPIVDGLKGWAIRDDDPKHCEMIFKIQKVAHKDEEHVEVEIKKQQ